MADKIEAPLVPPPKCYTSPALLGATFLGGCGALLLYYRWKRYVEGTFNDLNGSIEEVTESVSYIKHRLKTSDCCTCHDQADGYDKEEAHGSDEHHCDKTEFLKVIDALLQSSFADVEEAYYLMKGRIAENRDDPNFLVRLARAAHHLGLKHRKVDGECSLKRKMFVSDALKYAALALKLNRTDPETNKWYAITLGSATTILPFRERIRNLPHAKSHVEKALAMNPKDSILHHVLGRWHFAVASMTFAERTAAWLWLGFSETSTFHEARIHLLRSYNLQPMCKLNHLYIAKAHALENQIKNAIRWAERGLLLPSTNPLMDHQADKEIENLLKTLRAIGADNATSSYRALEDFRV